MPVKKGPFYAIFAQRFRQCTHGGIIVNLNHEVLDTNGNVMPGLYAGGDCTTEYTINSSNQTGRAQGGPGGAPVGQGVPPGGPGGPGGPPAGGIRGGVGIFGSYIASQGGGMMGLPKGLTAAISIAKYLSKKGGGL